MTINPVGETIWLFLALVVLFLWGIILPIKGKTLHPRRRLALRALRASLFLLLGLILLRPTLIMLQKERFAGTVLFLVDVSRSMQVADGPGGNTRFGTMGQLLQANGRELRHLAEQVEVRAYSFGRDLLSLPMSDGLFHLPPGPAEPESALSWALEELAQREAGRRILAVVVLSDGAQQANPPRDTPLQVAVNQYQRAGVPVFAVPFGEPRGAGRLTDIAVDNLLVPPAAVVDNEVIVSATVAVEGFPGKTLTVELWSEGPGQGERLASAEFTARSLSHQETVRLSFVPKSPGDLKLVVHIPPQPGENIPQNNTRSAILPVTRGGLRLLIVESFPPRPEFAFLRRALARGNQWELDVVLLDVRGKPEQLRELHEHLSTRDYQLLLIGNVPAWIVDTADWKLIVQKVYEGCGLIMVGGMWSFGPGGYADSPLADILPVRMSHLEIQRVDEPPRADVHLPGPIRLMPAGAHTVDFVFAGEETTPENPDVWSKLPPLDGSNKFEGIKPAAQVLLQTPERQPIVVYQPAGKGRVVAIGVDSTWRWALAGYRQFFERFWRQVVNFAANKEALRRGPLWIDLPQRSLAPGARADFSVRHEWTNQEAGELRFVAHLSGGGDSIALQPAEGGQSLRGSFEAPKLPGDYWIRVEAQRGGTMVESAQARFLVEDRDRELENPAADWTLLQHLAEATGGEVVRPEDFARLIQQLSRRTEELEATLEIRTPLWDKWPWLAAIVLLAAGEWYLRRRWGLV